MCVKAHELIADQCKYPLHVGITESGTLLAGNIKSSIGLGLILHQGIGDTIRVSLTGDPVEEIRSAKLILKTLGLRKGGIEVVSCPTCGRTKIDLIGLANQVEQMVEDIPLDILYEDEDVLIVNKPKGMVVHPAAGHYQGTLVNAVMAHCGDSLSGINGVMRPGIVHRIDKDTTGALLVCKNDIAHRDLAEQLKCHSIRRRYRAVVQGNLKEDEGTIEGPIGRHPTDRKKMAINHKNGKDAITHYKVLERFGEATYVECRLETGRTHQIRVHMAYIGHPVAGDPVYGPKKVITQLHGQCLHAGLIGFIHPRTGEYMEFTAPLPEYFVKLLEKLRK